MRFSTFALIALSALVVSCDEDDPENPAPPGQTQTPPGQTPPGQTPPGQTPPGQTPAKVTVDPLFHLDWKYRTATLYEEGEKPIITPVEGTAKFREDLTYELSYDIGGILNRFGGKYTIDGPDPKSEGSFLITTFNSDGSKRFNFSVAVGDTQGMALTIYGDDGKPSIVYGLNLIK